MKWLKRLSQLAIPKSLADVEAAYQRNELTVEEYMEICEHLQLQPYREIIVDHTNDEIDYYGGMGV